MNEFEELFKHVAEMSKATEAYYPQFAQTAAKMYRSMLDSLLAEGFTRPEAIGILTHQGMEKVSVG